MRLRSAAQRPGALTVEAAVVLPVMLFLFLMIISGGVAVLRYQQTVMLACEAARYASVHGQQYQQATGNASPTQAQIFQNAVVPMAAGMNANSLTIQVFLVNPTTAMATAWDNSNKGPWSLTATSQPVNNHVRITIDYPWTPGFIVPGTITLSSTCEIPMSF
jgi:Flp pilus assembly protein TadG